jgi:hypothetical protein
MRQAFTLLALMLIFVLAFSGDASPSLLPGIDGPTTGAGNDNPDEDHPWGGDRVSPDDPLLDDKTIRYSCLTGLPMIDVVISTLVDVSVFRSASSEYRRDVITERPQVLETGALSGTRYNSGITKRRMQR